MSTTPFATCPYKGLQPYTEEDRKYFFGRERDVEVVGSNLYVTPLTVLYGGSGVGKSSVLQAGVIPKLRAKARAVIVYFNEWQSDAFDEVLKRRVLAAAAEVRGVAAGEALAAVVAALDEAYEAGERGRPAPAGARAVEDFTLDDLLLGCARGLHLRVLLIFDQFEEYFLYHTPGTSEEGFDAEFARAVNQQDQGVNFMISMREEELSKLDRFRVRIPNLLTNLLRLEKLDREAAAEAITRPLDVYNAEHGDARMGIEPRLVEAILEQVAPEDLGGAGAGPQPAPGGPGGAVRIETPFLQVVLTRLWEEERRKGSDALRLETLDALGGAKNIARTHLDEVMAKLSEAERDVAASVLRFLVTPAGAKIAQQPTALASWAEVDAGAVRGVLTHLSSHQEMCILRKVTVPGQEERYELFHDVLGPAILDWHARYTQARRLARQRAEAEEKQRAERRRRRAKLVAVGTSALLVLLLGMGALTAFALMQQSEADRQRAEAERLRFRAEQQARIATDALAEAAHERDRANEQKAEAEKQKRLAEEQRAEAEKQKKLAEGQREEALRAQAREAEARRAADALRAEAEKQKRLAEAARDRASLSADAEKLTRLGMGELRVGHLAEARDLFARARAGYQQLDDISGQTATLANVAETYSTSAGVPPSGQLEALFGLDENDELNDASNSAAYIQLMTIGMTQEARKKLDKEQLEKLALDERRAVEIYKEALLLDRLNPRPDLTFQALIEKRLGGIYVWSGANKQFSLGAETGQSAEASQGAEAGQAMVLDGIRSYVRAAESYERAGQPGEQAQALRSAAALVYSFIDDEPDAEPPADLKRATDYYEQAAGIYERSGNAYEEAAVRLRLGALYAKSDNKTPDAERKAAASYERALSLLRGLSPRRPEAEALVAGHLAGLYEATDRARQVKYLSESLEGYVRLESGQPKTTELTDYRAAGHLKKLIELHRSEPARADAIFRDVIAAAGGNLAYQAGLLQRLGDEYWPEDKPRAFGYYARKAETWAEAKNPREEAQALFLLGDKYAEHKDTRASLEAYGRALPAAARIEWKAEKEKETVHSGPLLGGMLRAGKAFAAAGDRERAARAFREALAVSQARPSNDFATDQNAVMSAAASFHLDAGDEPAALAVFQKRLEAARRPDAKFDSARALVALADVYAAAPTTDAATRADYDRKALGYYEEARLLHQRERDNRGSDPLWAMRWTLRFYTGRQDQRGAVEYLTRLADSFRQAGDARREADVWMMFGEYYREAGNSTESVKSYDRVQRVDPNTPFERRRDIFYALRVICASKPADEEAKKICASLAEPRP